VSPWLPAVLRRSSLHLARIWHGRWLVGSTYSPFPSRSLAPGQSLRRLGGVKGGACAIAAATPLGALDAGGTT
jgi:hypothetical protein